MMDNSSVVGVTLRNGLKLNFGDKLKFEYGPLAGVDYATIESFTDAGNPIVRYDDGGEKDVITAVEEVDSGSIKNGATDKGVGIYYVDGVNVLL